MTNLATEAEIQREIKKYLTESGILCERIQSGTMPIGRSFVHLANAGHPDLVCYLRDGKTLLIEVKRGDGKLSADQVAYHDRLTQLGHKVITVRDLDSVKIVLADLGYHV